jgi:hypothetical protein
MIINFDFDLAIRINSIIFLLMEIIIKVINLHLLYYYSYFFLTYV